MSDVELRLHYETKVYRRRRFGKYRYGVTLYADGIFTNLAAVDLTREEAHEYGKFMATEAPDLLMEAGLYTDVYRAAYANRAYLATGVRVGDTVSLKEAVGALGHKGRHCRVKRVDLALNGTDADEYPVVVEIPVEDGVAGVPLELDEFEFVSSPYEQAQVSA